MEIFEGGYSKFDEVYNKAYWAKAYLDTRPCLYERKEASKHWKAFLKEKRECPTRANAAMQKVINRQSIYYPNFFELHKKDVLKNNPKIDMLVREIDSIEAKNYPKTRELREKLTKNNRITTSCVTKKLSGLQKLLLKLKLMF